MYRFNTKGIRSKRISIEVNGLRVPLLIMKPLNEPKNAPGVMWIHGGGYMTGMKEMAYIGRAAELVRNHGAVVIAPGYHLSLFHPYPTALNDCYGTLLYIKEHAKELGINPGQIMVGGESAGGGLAAAISMYARDKGEVNIAFQMPLYPMIDNFDTDSSRDNHAKVWNTRRNHQAWAVYLRKDAKKKVSPYAAPARQTDYSGLPPAYTFVCTAEPFYCETLTYIDNLKEAGIDAEVDVYEGMYHAFDMSEPESRAGSEAIKRFNEHFAFAKEHYFAEQD
ncbi:MAG: alpha/beta hydrolase [Butyrivibrio sp.]|nr:alpha/beta hydrolase [Butyrivibrio sp.]